MLFQPTFHCPKLLQAPGCFQGSLRLTTLPEKNFFLNKAAVDEHSEEHFPVENNSPDGKDY